MMRLEPGTLRRTSRRVPIGRFRGPAAWSPDRRSVALSVNSGRLEIVGLKPLGPAATIDTPGAVNHSWLMWTTPRRLFAMRHVPTGGLAVDIIDPVARAVLRSTALSGRPVSEGLQTAAVQSAANGGLAVLLTPERRIGAVVIAVVTPVGAIRRTRVPGISGGFDYVSGRHRGPAMALDRGGRRAYVVSASGRLVVEVDLASGRSTEHDLKPSRSLMGRLRDLVGPPAYAKWIDGPERNAALLNDRVLAVSGCDRSPGSRSHTGCPRPYGLHLIDTRAWTSRRIDKRAWQFTVTGDALVVDAAGYGERARLGLRVFGADGAVRIEAFRGRDVQATVAGSYVYVHILSPNGPTRALDVRTGRQTLLPARVPYLIPPPGS